MVMTSHVLPMRRGFIYRLHRQEKQSRLADDQSPLHQGYTVTLSGGWCVLRHITKLDNRPHILRQHCQLETLLWTCSEPLHRTFKWDEIARRYFQEDTAHVSLTRLRHVFGDRIISKDICPTLSPYAICGEQWKAKFAKTILTFSWNWRKPPQI
jgi:hypothetical protein